MTANSRAAEREHARKVVSSWVNRDATIYTVLRKVSRSGMRRSISLFVMLNGEPYSLDYWASQLLDRKIDRDNGGIICHGTGMDMGHELVYSLSMALFCPDKYDHDAAFSLNQRWL